MANELQVGAQNGLTIYAVVRRYADQYTWNNSTLAWEPWNSANLSNYAIPYTSQGGDLYTATFPAQIAAGTRVLIFNYSQAGGSPATTDIKLGAALDQTWNGTSLSSGSTVTANANALTYLASVKDYLRINQAVTSYDTQLQRVINQVSLRIQRYCNRNFVQQSYIERYSGDGERRLLLRQYPLVSVDRVAYGNAGAINPQYTGTAFIQAGIEVTNSAVILRTVTDAGVTATTTLAFTTYPSSDLMAAAIAAMPGWTCTNLVTPAVPMHDVNPMAGTSAIGNVPPLTYVNIDMVAYGVDYERGELMVRWDTFFPYLEGLTYGARFPRLFKSIVVYYTAGFNPVPDDIEGIANQIVGRAWREGIRDINLSSSKLGDYAVTMAQRVPILESEMQQLALYRDIPVGGRA